MLCCGGLALWKARSDAWLEPSSTSFKSLLADYGSNATYLAVAAKYKSNQQLR